VSLKRSFKLLSRVIFVDSSPTGVARNFDWDLGGPKLEKICDVILVTFFAGVMVMTSLK